MPLGGTLGLLLLFFVSVERRYQALWVSPAQDFCHVPIFALVTLLVAQILRGPLESGDGRQTSNCRSVFWAVAIGSLLALLIEWMQPWFGRSRSLVDVSFGLIGVSIAGLWLVGEAKLINPQTSESQTSESQTGGSQTSGLGMGGLGFESSAMDDSSTARKMDWPLSRCDTSAGQQRVLRRGGFWLRVAFTILLSWWPVERTVPGIADAAWSWLHYPELAVDGSWWERCRWELDRGVTMTRHHQPAEPSHSLWFQFPAQRPGSRAILWPVVSDWSAADWLELELTVPTDRWPLLIALRDATEVTPEQSRYNRYEVLSGGRQLIRIPLDDLPIPAGSPPIDLQHVTALILVNSDRVSRELKLHRVSVVRDR